MGGQFSAIFVLVTLNPALRLYAHRWSLTICLDGDNRGNVRLIVTAVFSASQLIDCLIDFDFDRLRF